MVGLFRVEGPTDGAFETLGFADKEGLLERDGWPVGFMLWVTPEGSLELSEGASLMEGFDDMDGTDDGAMETDGFIETDGVVLGAADTDGDGEVTEGLKDATAEGAKLGVAVGP
jgi:hypothetical protein